MNSESNRNIVVAIYTHPEFYPPLLNAIDALSDKFSSVIIISRNLKNSQWQYPGNAELTASGPSVDVRKSEIKPVYWKIRSFIRYSKDFLKLLKKTKPAWVMCNDSISLFAYKMIRPFLKFPVQLWYHSHDVAELRSMRPFSVGYYAVKSEKKYFGHIDLFTIPTEDRLKYFPVKRLKGFPFVVPNYPSLRRMQQNGSAHWENATKIKLLYQGRVSDEHGLEELIGFVKTDPNVLLTIVGPGSDEYLALLKSKIDLAGVIPQVALLEPVPYSALRTITLDHHIGIAINKPVNIVYQTGATASNKIYEYASAGLPVLYYRDEHYTHAMRRYRWAIATDLSFLELSAIISNIREHYKDLSDWAQQSFREELNFEKGFKPVLSFVWDRIKTGEQVDDE